MRDEDTGRERSGAARCPSRHSRRAILRGAAGAAAVGLLAARSAAGWAVDATPPATGATVPTPASAGTGAATVFPRPGSRTASPATEITFRGAAANAVGTVQAVGSRSGGHAGVLLPHADGRGASFLPDAPFAPGEHVTVRTELEVRGGEGGAFGFTVALPVTRAAPSRREKTAHDPAWVRAFRSRPDLVPPTVAVTARSDRTAPGYVFVAPKKEGQDGALILDDRGEPVWFFPLTGDVEQMMDFRVQRYRGEPVLTWWQGISTEGRGLGHAVLRDATYREIGAVRVGNGYPGADLHEFLVTPQDTALVLAYNPVRWDLSSVDGPAYGVAVDGIVLELEIATGRVLFEWHSLDHVGLDESYLEPSEKPDAAFDYFHVNAVALDGDGDLVVTARNSWAVYKIDRTTGDIAWRLNGKRSDFAMGVNTTTAYHHDARVQPTGELTIFDNGATPKVHDQSRGVVLELDSEAMTATLAREYVHPEGVLAGSQGNMQVLPNGNVLVGWGSEPVVSEIAGDGTLLFDARFPPDDESYRAYRFPWTGRPGEAPAVAAEVGPGGGVTVYASWNGATEVAAWRVLAGPAPDRLRPVGSAPRAGFETAIAVRTADPYVAAQAVDHAGTVLGVSTALALGT